MNAFQVARKHRPATVAMAEEYLSKGKRAGLTLAAVYVRKEASGDLRLLQVHRVGRRSAVVSKLYSSGRARFRVALARLCDLRLVDV